MCEYINTVVISIITGFSTAMSGHIYISYIILHIAVAPLPTVVGAPLSISLGALVILDVDAVRAVRCSWC